MPEDPLHQRHDKLFKSGFSDPANAAGFLRGQFPQALATAIDWGGLRLEPGTFVDSQFRHSESDLLFSAPLHGGACLIYLLFEHQRAFDPWIALRLLRYMVRIWEQWQKKHPQAGKLPVILPVVLAQNARTWNIPTRFATLLDIPAAVADDLAGQAPDFLFRLVQLADLPFEKITGTPAGILVLRALKAEQIEKLLGEELWDEALIARAQGTFEMILRYILSQADIDKAAFARRVDLVESPDIKNAAMTLAQQFRQEGRILAQQRAVIEALEIRFERVPDGLREEIGRISDSGQLHALLRAAIRCADIESFTREL